MDGGPKAPYAIVNENSIPEIVRLTALGYSPLAIAKVLKKAAVTVYKLMATEDFQSQLKEIRRSADRRALEFQERLALASESALDRIVELAETSDAGPLRLMADRTIIKTHLDASGIGNGGRGGGASGPPVHFHLGDEASKRLVEALTEVTGRTIDVTPPKE